MSLSHVTVSAAAGEYRGSHASGVNQFVGIRYAAAPVGEARFQPPSPLEPDTDPIDATEYGGINYQVGKLEEIYAGMDVPGEESEDCLFLNICTPEDMTGPKPVMFWIHGGAFQSGSGNEYDPSNLVRDNDVVVVTVNYRLGIFGFLNLEKLGPEYAGSGNLGIQDQIAALKWVQANIAAFGGDTSNVTIWGESAGAGSVHSLLGAPAAEGLFHKAIVFSGGETLTPPIDQLDPLKACLGCESDQECLEELLALPAQELSQLQQQAGFFPGPSVDGTVITRSTCEAIKDGASAAVPILAGATRDEGTLLAPAFALSEEIGIGMIFALATSVSRDDGAAYLAFLERDYGSAGVVDKMSRAWFDTFRSSALRVAVTASVHGAGGWVFNFEVETDHPLGITHFADVPFTFNWLAKEDHPMLFVHPPTAINQQLAQQWSRTVVAFARTGSPNGQGLPDWPQYRPESFVCLRLSAQPKIVYNPDGDELLSIYKVV